MGYLLCPCGINHKFTHNLKLFNMKKLLFVLAIASFAACKNGADASKTADSTKVDSSKVVIDSTKKDSSKVMVDSTKKDSTKK